MTAQNETCTCTLPLLVVEGDGPSLIGRNWLTELLESSSCNQPKLFTLKYPGTEQRKFSTRPRQD